MPSGSEIYVGELVGDWRAITYDGICGFVKDSFLTDETPKLNVEALFRNKHERPISASEVIIADLYGESSTVDLISTSEKQLGKLSHGMGTH